ncbi:MAG: hypothetical protein NT027_18895, partial [Proteobacteria bacterium]|nr:hypothetical protein [Pseudomonadota bacterium]
ARIISFNDSKNQSSSIQSLKTGFRFQLPIDGKMPLPNFLGGDAIPTEDGTRYLQHLMNWTVTISSRPNVVRKGKYGDPDDILASTTPNYLMATDAAGSYGDDNIAVEEYMNPYHLVSFQTTHRWKVFNQVWQKVETPTTEITSQKQKLKPKQEPIELTWEEKARRELLFSLDRAFIDGRELNSTDQAQWFTNKYRLLDTDYYEPVSFSASISYDYLKEQKRRSEGRTNANRPWSDADGSISFNAKGWSLSDSSRYNIYDRYFSRHALSLTPPGFLSTSTSFGYILENSISDNNGVKTFVATREKTATVVTSLTAPVYTTWSWGQKQVDGSDDAPYRQKMSFVYGSPSRCWGVGFSREKDYGQDEIAPTYRLQLNIVFMDQPRDLPDMSPTVTRELQKL